MKVNFEWLKELAGISWSPEATAEKLTQLGFPVDAIHATGVKQATVVAAKILTVKGFGELGFIVRPLFEILCDGVEHY